MRSTVRAVILAACAVTATATTASASFRASDLIYIPTAVSLEGSNNTFRTDLWISNVDEVDIDVAVIYLRSGLVNNASVFLDRSLWLGGREDDGFGFINESLADIPPNGSVNLEDLVAEYWLDDIGANGLGALVIFAYEAGTLEADGTRVFRNAVAQARVYNDTFLYTRDPDSHGFLETPATYGWTMPGYPWYTMAIPELEEFSFQVLTGGIQTEDYGYNVGVLNTSDPLTQITISVQPFQPNGDPYLDENENEILSILSLPPAGHFQWNLMPLLQWGLEDVTEMMIKVSFLNWGSTAADPIPGFITYGEVLDRVSGDATTILPSFSTPFDVDCMFPTDPQSVTKSARGWRQGPERPLSVPPAFN